MDAFEILENWLQITYSFRRVATNCDTDNICIIKRLFKLYNMHIDLACEQAFSEGGREHLIKPGRIDESARESWQSRDLG